MEALNIKAYMYIHTDRSRFGAGGNDTTRKMRVGLNVIQFVCV